jgi:hypothetical protein
MKVRFSRVVQMCRPLRCTISRSSRMVQMQGINGYGEGAILDVCEPSHIH